MGMHCCEEYGNANISAYIVTICEHIRYHQHINGRTAPKRNFSDPRAISVLARYKRDLQSVKAVKAELEKTLGWETTLQTVWRHLKRDAVINGVESTPDSLVGQDDEGDHHRMNDPRIEDGSYEQGQAMLSRMKSEYSTADRCLSREIILEDNDYSDDEEKVDVDDVDDDSYISSLAPPELFRESRIADRRYLEEYYHNPSSSPPNHASSSQCSASASSEAHAARCRRLTMSSIVIPEKDNPNFVRVYRQTARTKDTAYYRCSTCDTISRRMRADGSSTAGDGDEGEERMEIDDFMKRPRATVKAVHGRVVGNPYPEHHRDCHPIPADEQRALEIDRSCRAKVKYGEAPPKSAWIMGRRMAESSFSKHEMEGQNLPFPEWKRVRKQYYALARTVNRNIPKKQPLHADTFTNIHKDDDLYCEEQFDEGVSQAEEVLSVKDAVPIQRTLSKRLTMSSIVVPDASGDTVRVYRMGSTSKDGHTSYYRCSKCETLSHKPRITPTGVEEGPFPRARIRMVDGRVVGNAYPAHHPDCRPMSARIFKAQEIDTGCRYRIKQGLISPRRAWDLGQQIAESESFNDDNEEGIPFPQWDKVKRRYYKLSRGKKAKMNCVDDALFGEDRLDPRSSNRTSKSDAAEQPQQSAAIKNEAGDGRNIASVHKPKSTLLPQRRTDEIDEPEASSSHEIEGHNAEIMEKSLLLERPLEEPRSAETQQMERIQLRQFNRGHSRNSSGVERVVQELQQEPEGEPELEPEPEPEFEPELEPEALHLRKRTEYPHCSCKQFYEANLELHDDIVRCLNEMKAMRNEVRQMRAEMRIERSETKSIPMRFFP